MEQHRRIYKTRVTGAETLRELLQSMFIGELLETGKEIWIVSPWVGNIILIDNRTGTFDTLNPEWGRREIRLLDVLLEFLARGTRVILLSRDEPTNASFISQLKQSSADLGLEGKLRIHMDPEVHDKGVLLSNSMLEGSMNLTYSGLVLNKESITFWTEQRRIEECRQSLIQQYPELI